MTSTLRSKNSLMEPRFLFGQKNSAQGYTLNAFFVPGFL
jgi:hypothetical protein